MLIDSDKRDDGDVCSSIVIKEMMGMYAHR